METSRALDASLHDVETRPLVAERRTWTVRAAPGDCRLGLSWLRGGLWHLQFSSTASARGVLSVLTFPMHAPVPAPFLVLVPGLLRSVWLSATELDELWGDHTGLCGPSAAMMTMTAILFEQTLSAAGRTALARARGDAFAELGVYRRASC